jgi:hypothetical protein
MATLPSGLPDTVANDEDLARFLTQSSQFNTQIVKPAAFLPSPKDRETSVSRHSSQSADSLWQIGLGAAGDRKLYGAAMFKAHSVKAAQLEVMPDEPPNLHAVIRNWPWIDSDPELQKAKQKEMALVLASLATLLLRQ